MPARKLAIAKLNNRAPAVEEEAPAHNGSRAVEGDDRRSKRSSMRVERSIDMIVVKNATGTRDNISVINGRKYIDLLKMECGADGFDMVGSCKEGEEGKGEHRCTGVKGGHPDLIAWEVAEILNKL